MAFLNCEGKTGLREKLLTLGYADEDIRNLKLFDNCTGQAETWYGCKIARKGSTEAVLRDYALCGQCLNSCRTNNVLTTLSRPLDPLKTLKLLEMQRFKKHPD